MLVVSLVLGVVLGQLPDVDAMDLVPRLGARRYLDRETASGQLEQLGRKAMLALQTAREFKDPEVRIRAASILHKIEGSLLTKPTLVTMDFENETLAKVAASIGEQSGIKIQLVPDNAPHWKTRKVTIKEKAPLTFWKALDQFCEVGRVQYNVTPQPGPNGREAVLTLFEGGMKPTSPVCDSGPFRTTVMSLFYKHEVNFPPVRLPGPPRGIAPAPGASGPTDGRPAPAFDKQFFALLQISGEPRLTLSQTGPLKIIEAVDDKGQALAPGASRGMGNQRLQGYYGMATGTVLQQQAVLTRPEVPGKTIRTLKGSIPVLVSTRKPGPLAIKLEGAAGKTFKNDEVAITVHEIRQIPNSRQTSVELSVRPSGGANPGFGSPTPLSDLPGGRPELFQSQFDIFDAEGHPLNWFPSNFDVEAGRMTLLTMATPDPNVKSTPAEIRFFSLARAATEVNFEFNDLPLP